MRVNAWRTDIIILWAASLGGCDDCYRLNGQYPIKTNVSLFGKPKPLNWFQMLTERENCKRMLWGATVFPYLPLSSRLCRHRNAFWVHSDQLHMYRMYALFLPFSLHEKSPPSESRYLPKMYNCKMFEYP